MTNSPTPNHNKLTGITMTIILIIVIVIFIGYRLKRFPAPAPATPPAINNHTETAASQTGGNMISPQPQKDIQKPAAVKKQKTITIDDHTIAGIKDFLKSWLQAWKKSAGGNLKPYFAHYVHSFRTKSLDHQAWQNAKSIRNRGKSWIDISIKNLQIHPLTDNQLRLVFNQEYSSSNFSDKSRKELILQQTPTGWLISGEQEINHSKK